MFGFISLIDYYALKLLEQCCEILDPLGVIYIQICRFGFHFRNCK